MNGRFIVIDGPDGTGTSLHAKMLTQTLRDTHVDAILTAEPTDGPIGTFIRAQLKKETFTLSSDAIQLLFCADRAEHVATVIEKNLELGKIIVCDRYVPSTIIYGDVLGLDVDWLLKINARFRIPDVTIFTLPPFEVALQRVMRREEHDAFEKEELMKKIHDGYHKYAERHPEIHVIDTSGEKEEVAKQILEIIESL